MSIPRPRQFFFDGETGAQGVAFWQCSIHGSAIHSTPVADGDDDDLQGPVLDFINHPIIAHSNPLRVAAFEFLHIRLARVGFQSGQSCQNPAGVIIRQTIKYLPDRFRYMSAYKYNDMTLFSRLSSLLKTIF